MVYQGGDDPTLRNLRSSLGKQVKTSHETQPAWGFGSAPTDGYQKLYLSPEQAAAMQGNNSQGAVYKSYPGIGPQVESVNTTLPAYGFGTSTRSIKYGSIAPGPGHYKQEGGLGSMKDSRRATEPRVPIGTATREQQDKLEPAFGSQSPGPCQYTKPGGLGKQAQSQYRTETTQKIGTAARWADKNAHKETPGAGSYSTYGAMGKQSLSNKKTLPNPKIGTSVRDKAGKVYISKEHGKAMFGQNSPGPTTGIMVNSFGKQQLSVKKSNPSFGFGTSKRPPLVTSDAPGPATYFA